jgi:hypothetical protein
MYKALRVCRYKFGHFHNNLKENAMIAVIGLIIWGAVMVLIPEKPASHVVNYIND